MLELVIFFLLVNYQCGNYTFMELKTWLRERSISVEKFAEYIECQPATVHRYIQGTRTPKREAFERIFKETGGEVTANDFFDFKKSA